MRGPWQSRANPPEGWRQNTCRASSIPFSIQLYIIIRSIERYYKRILDLNGKKSESYITQKDAVYNHFSHRGVGVTSLNKNSFVREDRVSS